MSRTSSSQRQILSWISETWSDASPHIDCFATWISDSTISLRVPRNKRLVTRRTGETGSGASTGQLQMYPREKIGTIPDTLGKSVSGPERDRRKSCDLAAVTVYSSISLVAVTSVHGIMSHIAPPGIYVEPISAPTPQPDRSDPTPHPYQNLPLASPFLQLCHLSPSLVLRP